MKLFDIEIEARYHYAGWDESKLVGISRKKYIVIGGRRVLLLKSWYTDEPLTEPHIAPVKLCYEDGTEILIKTARNTQITHIIADDADKDGEFRTEIRFKIL